MGAQHDVLIFEQSDLSGAIPPDVVAVLVLIIKLRVCRFTLNLTGTRAAAFARPSCNVLRRARCWAGCYAPLSRPSTNIVPCIPMLVRSTTPGPSWRSICVRA